MPRYLITMLDTGTQERAVVVDAPDKGAALDAEARGDVDEVREVSPMSIDKSEMLSISVLP